MIDNIRHVHEREWHFVHPGTNENLSHFYFIFYKVYILFNKLKKINEFGLLFVLYMHMYLWIFKLCGTCTYTMYIYIINSVNVHTLHLELINFTNLYMLRKDVKQLFANVMSSLKCSTILQ